MLHFGQRKKVFVPRTTSVAFRISAAQNGHIGAFFGGSMNELQRGTFNSFLLYDTLVIIMTAVEFQIIMTVALVTIVALTLAAHKAACIEEF